MKILHVNKLYRPWIGGVEDVVRDIVVGLRDEYEGEILVCQPRGRRSVDEVDNVTVTRASSMGILLGMPISLDFFNLFREKMMKSDLIFLHHPFPLGFLAYLLFGKKKKLVVWYHSDIVRQRFSGLLFRPLLKLVLKRAEKIFVSNENLPKHSSILRRYKSKCVSISFGVDLDKFKATSGVEDKSKQICDKFGAPLVLSVGRLVYYKGFSYLIKAMENIEANLLIIGAGDLKDKLTEDISRLGLGHKVSILPPVEDLVPYYHACDVFVLPSVEPTEAFGIVQLEAMASGRPVINTDLPTGVPLVGVHGETGLTVKPKDVDALVSALDVILSDSNLKLEFGKKAKDRIKNHFTKSSFIASVKEELTRLR